MGLEAATYISDFVSSNPTAGDNTSQGDDHIRLGKSVLQATFPNASKAFRFPVGAAVAAGNVSVVFPDDQNKLFPVSADAAARTVNLPDPSAGGTANEDGFTVTIVKTDTSANAVTIDPSGAQTINGASTLVLMGLGSWAICIWNKLDATWYAYSNTISANLDMNGKDLIFDDNTGIRDDSNNEQLIFQKTASAINQLEITNASAGNAPSLSAAGDDTNIDIRLAGKGTGGVVAVNYTDRLEIVAPATPIANTTRTYAKDEGITAGQFYKDDTGRERPVAPVGSIIGRAYVEVVGAFIVASTTLPFDNTIPQISEGEQLLSVSYQAKYLTSRLRFTFNSTYSTVTTVRNDVAAALFNNLGSLDAMAVCFGNLSSSSAGADDIAGAGSIGFIKEVVINSVANVTYQIRVGRRLASGITLNASVGATLYDFGGIVPTTLVIEEILA